MSDAIKICVVDDDAAIRDALDLLLGMSGYAVRTYESAKLFLQDGPSPDCSCLIADIRMPDMDGLELQQELARRQFAAPMIIMTGHGDVPLAVRAMKAGASDFLEKPFAEETLLDSIAKALLAGKTAEIARLEAQSVCERMKELTDREREVLNQLIDGHQTKMIAHNLNISPRTVEVYRGRIMEKMKARTVAELVRLTLSAKG